MRLIIILLVACLSGCGALFHDREQPVAVEILDDAGGTNCTAHNDRGKYPYNKGAFVVDRDDTPLNIECHNRQQTGKAKVEPHTVWKWYILDIVIGFPCILTCITEDALDGADRYPDKVSVMMDYKGAKPLNPSPLKR